MSAVELEKVSSPRFSVLVVDDEAEVRSQLCLRFQLEGFQVLDADGGEAAYRAVERHRPDLVITDIRMAGGTGTELLKRLSADSRDDMPVVLCITGYSDLQVYEAYNYGAYAVFQKPFDLKDVVHASRRFLDLRAKQRVTSTALAAIDRDLRQVLGVVKHGRTQQGEQAVAMSDLHQVISMIVHEVNSPLAVISMNATLLAKALTQGAERLETAQRMVGVIDQNSQRLIEICQTLRDLFSAQARSEPTQVNLADVIKEAIAVMDEHASLAGLDVCVKPGDGLVLGVRRQLVQLVRNLLENAAHASRQAGEKRIDVELSRQDGAVILTVTDRGDGVPEAIRDDIFEPYFTTKGQEGFGMGLAICRKVAEAHSGSIALAPTKVGAQFVLTLKAPK